LGSASDLKNSGPVSPASAAETVSPPTQLLLQNWQNMANKTITTLPFIADMQAVDSENARCIRMRRGT